MSGKTSTELMKEYQMASSTTSGILSAKEKILKFNETRNKIRQRSSKYPKLEEALNDWLKQIISNNNVTVDGLLIQCQAIKYATFLGHNEFKASNGWLDCFKKDIIYHLKPVSMKQT